MNKLIKQHVIGQTQEYFKYVTMINARKISFLCDV